MNTDLISDLVITRVCSVATMYTLANKKAKRNNRPRWAIISKFEGETVYTANGRRLLSDLDHVIMLPKGSSYEWECTKSGHYCCVEFECDKELDSPLFFSAQNGQSILRSLKDLECRRNLRSGMFEMESIRDLYSVILDLAKDNRRYIPNHKRQKIQPTIEYISQNFEKNIKNDTLASIAGMSTVYYRKLFTEVMGVPPITYAKQLRIEKAKEMLKSDYITLTDIATSLGYSGLYDFSRDFKKHTGVAPSKY